MPARGVAPSFFVPGRGGLRSIDSGSLGRPDSRPTVGIMTGVVLGPIRGAAAGHRIPAVCAATRFIRLRSGAFCHMVKARSWVGPEGAAAWTGKGGDLDFSFKTKGVSLSDTDRDAIREKFSRLNHLADASTRVEVKLFEERNPSIPEKEICEVTLHTKAAVVRAKGSGMGVLAAADRVYDRLEHRLEKLKGKLVDRSQPPHRPPKVIPELPEEERFDELALLGGARIVKSKTFKITTMTPAEAALQMQLLSHSFYFFTNHETGRPAVVYQRNDGNVGLIDAVDNF